MLESKNSIIIGWNKVSKKFIKNYNQDDFIIFKKEKNFKNKDLKLFDYELIKGYNFQKTKNLYYFFEEFDKDFLLEIREVCEKNNLNFFIASNHESVNKKKFLNLIDINLLFNKNNFYTKIIFRLFDIILSLFSIILSLPFFIILSILIFIEDGFPIFFSHKRVGYKGKQFTMYKFRSMKKSSNKYDTSPIIKDDHRITRIGRIIRRTSLDELPQFFNVFFGDMSIVGPRPEMKFIVKNYNEFELLRLKIKPGLTGTWQVSDTRNAPIHHNLDYDLHQIMYYSFSYNMKQIINTILWATKGF